VVEPISDVAARTEFVAGVSLSLSGAFGLQGRDALNGIELWADHVEREGTIALRLIACDDGSSAERAQDNVLRLLTRERVDLLLGPYSSGLTMAVAPLAEAHGKILWNHGGASDAIWERGWRHVVSVPSPASDYLRTLPHLVKRRDPGARRISVLHAKAGSFAAYVAAGVADGAKRAGFDVIRLIPFDSPIRDAEPLIEEGLAADPDLLVGVGRFEDDVAIVRSRDLLGTVKTLACVGAGLEAFDRELGDLAEGVIGPSQWEPNVHHAPLAGPGEKWFCSEFERAFHQRPGYPAAQAFAVGIVIIECLRRGGTLEDESLLRAAHSLDTTTLYGRFRLAPTTSRQIGHHVLLVQWRSGRKVVIQDDAS
jgi:branched-chain amino acid transport system substrate-binding protein